MSDYIKRAKKTIPNMATTEAVRAVVLETVGVLPLGTGLLPDGEVPAGLGVVPEGVDPEGLLEGAVGADTVNCELVTVVGPVVATKLNEPAAETLKSVQVATPLAAVS